MKTNKILFRKSKIQIQVTYINFYKRNNRLFLHLYLHSRIADFYGKGVWKYSMKKEKLI